jgi:hypothetical protein
VGGALLTFRSFRHSSTSIRHPFRSTSHGRSDAGSCRTNKRIRSMCTAAHLMPRPRFRPQPARLRSARAARGGRRGNYQDSPYLLPYFSVSIQGAPAECDTRVEGGEYQTETLPVGPAGLVVARTPV